MAPLRDRSIREKLNIILGATTLLALLLAGIALVLFDLRTQVQTIKKDLLMQADIIGLASSSALEFDDRKVGAENLSVLRANEGIAVAALYDKSHRLYASYRSPDPQAPPLPASPPPEGARIDGAWVTVARPVVSNRETIGTVYLQARHDLVARVLEYLAVLFAILASSLAGALLLANRLQRLVTAPILAVSAVAQNILKGGNFGLRAPKTSDDEVGALVDGFNAMLDELERRADTLEEANSALRESEARYQLAVRGSSAGLWDWDMRAGTMFYSPRFKAVLGYTQEEFPDLPQAVSAILHPDDRAVVASALRAHLQRDIPYQLECRLRLKSGAWRWFFVAGMAQRDGHDKAYRMAGSMIDITARKQAELALQEANRAKDEFIATLAHELRNPLAPIRTGLELLRRDKANGPASERARETMERQLQHMIRLIDDLLDISRINSGKIRIEPQRIDLALAIESAVEISRPAVEAGAHRLTVTMPPQPIVLMADFTRLAQSVGNLLHNAAKYTPPGGQIHLRTWQDGATAVIEIRDTGVGIPADMLQEVFTLFTQVRRTLDQAQGGLGIGLSLVRSLVELHGGSVSAASPGAGQGSTFTIRIPCLQAQPGDVPTPSASPQQQPEATRPRKVLVVDDNVDAAETLATVLEMMGHQTRTVHAGPPVFDAAVEFAPDVVFLDIGLPGMDGYDVARQLRADGRFSETLLVALTGWGSEADRRRAQDAGFDHHLTKPVDFSALSPLLEGGTAAVD
jgi:PAS domain S-box-containing protein